MNSSIPLVVIAGIITVFIFYIIATTFPSATGTIANSTLTTGATACKNCDSGIKTLGQQTPFILMAVVVIATFIVVIIAIRNR